MEHEKGRDSRSYFDRPSMVLNRKYTRTNQVLGHALHLLRPYLRDDAYRPAARALNDFFDSQGVQLITEADRIAAGLEPRDHNGLTLQELVVIETKLIEAMMQPPMMVLTKEQAEELTKRAT